VCKPVVLLIVALPTLVFGPLHTSANILNDVDRTNISDLSRRVNQLNRDTLDSARGSPSNSASHECLLQLHETFNTVSYLFIGEGYLVGTASYMRDEEDENTAASAVLSYTGSMIDIFVDVRSHVNKLLGICSHLSLSYSKARQMLNFT
jgi:hypothetical protein